MNNLLLRTFTGILFVLTILGSLWIHEYLALIVFSLFFLGSIIEFKNLFSENDFIELDSIGFLTNAVFSFVIVILVIVNQIDSLFLLLIPPMIFLFALRELWRNKKHPIINLSIGVFGFIYLVLPFSLIVYLNQIAVHSCWCLIGMFLLIWSNDTFAYLTGRFLGKTKLFERISPKKTWEGTIGGIICTLLCSVLLASYTEVFDYIFWLISALIIIPTAVLGDLMESMFKRNLKIKDSGSILPGHGGILDRFDATLFVVPFYFCWVIFYQTYFA